MKEYRITVNGNTYDVEVEEVGASQSNREVVQKATPRADFKPSPTKTPAKKKAPSPAPTKGGEGVTAPMPGVIVDIKVNEGDMVQSGDVLLILEAMKMENEIVAPKGGKVTSINTTKGASVNSGDMLISIE
ncbi:biotin/lipoyl-containing protein [Clostridiisalibacter paucivorans]|uniref:biotin/lipoyl-containing protein n=1 Tax=Clostridiisalibacter paucivorans TaxID=408753 RepID=UPI00047E08AB|nr:biotin/lipoyl-containing protein [Clostridiisalibacter paucivorans]